jgi:hypothetical protein
MSAEIDAAVADVLSSKRLKLVHPGDGKLTQVYATPGETTSVLAEAITHRGQYRVASNNLALGAQSNFILSTSAILDDPILTISITPPKFLYFSHNGWGFDLIDSYEITYANSLMQNMVIRGDVAKEYAKLCCNNREAREEMLAHAGELSHGSSAAGGFETRVACIPLSFLNFNTSGKRGSWPIDASVLAGPIQITINWVTSKVSSRIFVDDDTGSITLPTALNSAEITCTTITLQKASFGVKDAMMKDRSLVYSIPARYLSIVNESTSVSAIDNVININLNSAPAGMLEGILIYCAPNDTTNEIWTGSDGSTKKKKHGGSLTLANLQLQFGSQDLVRYRSRQEMLAFNRANFGDNLSYDEYIIAPLQKLSILTYAQVLSDIIFIPLIQNGKGVFNGHVNENVPSYGGSQLQLTIQFTKENNETTPAPAVVGTPPRPFGPPDSTPFDSTELTIYICYIISALLEVSQGTVDLQL